jgi:hypothetical protein
MSEGVGGDKTVIGTNLPVMAGLDPAIHVF